MLFHYYWSSPARFKRQYDNVRVTLVIRQCKRTAKGALHACVSGQKASYARVIVAHFVELIVFFFEKMYNRCLVSFTNFVIVLINW